MVSFVLHLFVTFFAAADWSSQQWDLTYATPNQKKKIPDDKPRGVLVSLQCPSPFQTVLYPGSFSGRYQRCRNYLAGIQSRNNILRLLEGRRLVLTFMYKQSLRSAAVHRSKLTHGAFRRLRHSPSNLLQKVVGEQDRHTFLFPGFLNPRWRYLLTDRAGRSSLSSRGDSP